MAHTPGPWSIVRSPRPDSNSPDYLRIDGAAGRRVAEMYGEEDAHLIAAAPELLEALKTARFYLTSPLAASMNAGDAIDRIDAAIAKATGGDS